MEIKTLTLSAATHEQLKKFATEHKISMAQAIKDLISQPPSAAPEMVVVIPESLPAIPGTGRAELSEQIQNLNEAGSRAKDTLKSAIDERDNDGVLRALKILTENF
jgi:hypothetical protein